MAEKFTFTPELRDELRREYDKAYDRARDQFTWRGHVLLTAYAAYLLEYLDSKFPPTDSTTNEQENTDS